MFGNVAAVPLLVLALAFKPAQALAGLAMPIVKNATSGTELATNGGFEQAAQDRLANWSAAPQGYFLAVGQGRNGSQCLHCDNPQDKAWYGASQSVTLNRTNILPLVVSGWSKARAVGGGSDSGYSLYVDLLYADGTPLWGQTANFATGTHDWQRREFLILPEKPVKSLTLHCLFRNHSGQVWFDDVSITELRTPGDAVLFQGAAVSTRDKQLRAKTTAVEPAGQFNTQDGLNLEMRGSEISSLKLGPVELAAGAPSGFLARDVAADSDFCSFEKNNCPELGLKLESQVTPHSNHIVVEGRLSDTRGTNRAVTFVFALPLNASGWNWGDDIRHSRVIQGQAEFSKMVSIKCGATGTMSLYPLAAIWNEHQGLAVALNMAKPAQYRLGYHPGTKQLFIAYDFGLARETERFPSSAEFRFVVYRFDPRWGFRAAFQKLIDIFPEYFRVRSRDQGLWMPFTDIATVQGWEDFGFKYHEGNNAVPWDDQHGVLSFRYTEPMTWWMRMPKESPRTIQEAVRLRNELVAGTSSDRRMARVSELAAMWDESNQPSLLFRDEPWCHGAVWSLNPNPHLPDDPSLGSPGPPSAPPRLNASTVHWNQKVREELYGSATKGKLDGEYLDSLEGYVTADLNFRLEHFRYTTVPLTFSSETKQPALFKGLAVFEFTRWFCDQVHSLDRLTFANGVPYRFTFLCPWLDVLGTETDWVRDRKYSPASHEQMSLWRTMSGAKPYLLLMNTDYDVFTSEMVERYFQRSLFYGMFPGMFSHNAADNPYWQNPKWYNRDRPLFKRYLPLIKQVAEAGWQPVTGATCDNPNILIERFGPDDRGQIYFTLFNESAARERGRLRIEDSFLAGPKPSPPRELLSGTTLKSAASADIELEPQTAEVIELTGY